MFVLPLCEGVGNCPAGQIKHPDGQTLAHVRCDLRYNYKTHDHYKPIRANSMTLLFRHESVNRGK